jgi:hypothetical protein
MAWFVDAGIEEEEEEEEEEGGWVRAGGRSG